MTLYTADVLDLAKPLQTLKVIPPKKPSTKKTPVTPPGTPENRSPPPIEPIKQVRKRKTKIESRESTPSPIEPIPPIKLLEKNTARKVKVLEPIQESEENVTPVPEKKKRVVTEKQKAALALAREKRAQQKMDVLVENTIREVVENNPITSKPKQKRQRKNFDPEEPPKWFEKYVQGVKREQEGKKPTPQETKVEAKTKWDNGLVRDRVRNEVDSHMNRMYSMIFNR
ncbi:hypothetical protein QT971_06325 [Microcoleus sp. herbarium19]|uniref:hypothetical protein n=1 Tax=Microcoleus sp. herbarium19 TaxID=3055440 RepID=UPI002FD0986D